MAALLLATAARTVAAGPSAVRHGLVEVNGTVLPAVGFYSYYDQGLPSPSCSAWPLPLELEASHGMRLEVPYVRDWGSGEVDNGTMAFLDRAAAVGVSILLDLSALTNLQNGGYPHTPVAPDLPVITRLVSTLRTHPAILGWYTADEPDAGEGAYPAAWLESLYHHIHAIDGEHVVAMAFSSVWGDHTGGVCSWPWCKVSEFRPCPPIVSQLRQGI